MNRVIKFRAWDEDSQTMLNPVDLSGPISTYHWLGKKDVALMQYTGLNDSNCVDIYEGDLIKTINGIIATVEWEKEGRFLGFTIDKYRKIIYINREPSVEIIGNIYENPELLEK